MKLIEKVRQALASLRVCFGVVGQRKQQQQNDGMDRMILSRAACFLETDHSLWLDFDAIFEACFSTIDRTDQILLRALIQIQYGRSERHHEFLESWKKNLLLSYETFDKNRLFDKHYLT